MTKTSKFSVLNSLFLFMLCVGMVWLISKNQSPAKIAYVDSEYLFTNYAGTTESYKELEAKTKEWADNLDSLSKEYQNTFTAYEEQKQELTTNSKKALETTLAQQQQQFNSYYEATKKKKQETDKKLTDGVIKQIDTYLQAFAKEQGYSMIFGGSSTQNNLVYAEGNHDVTEQVLDYINKQYYGLDS